MDTMLVLAAVAGIALGGVIGFVLRRLLTQNKMGTAEQRAEKIIQEAKTKEQEIILQAKEKALAVVEEGKRELDKERGEVKDAQLRLAERERMFDKTLLEFENRKAKIDHEKTELDRMRARVEELAAAAEARLQEIAGLTKADAERVLMERVEGESKDALMSRLRKMEQDNEEEVEAKARKILSLAIQRFASSHVVDATTTFVQLPGDDMKGRIIGKEGRNIKALEHLTGCEFIIDDTPESITISGFSPVRRQVAKRALEMLMKDGRIQPAKATARTCSSTPWRWRASPA
ncbi:DUF3552 domain-containing protein [Candidatus Uhrbacteria bacterium]|nr:DUF3552 domain-containing protein [Candidatus Uhrbacteria bacterium]